jgi:carboxypeptidase Q
MTVPRRPSLSATTAVAFAMLAILAVVARGQEDQRIDRDTLDRLQALERQHSELMPVFSRLTDVYGPRLTASPNYKRAGEYARAALADWGLSNVHLEEFGPFVPGWAVEHVSLNVVLPQPYPVIGYPLAWTPGTSGTITADVVHATIASETDFAKYRGVLKRRFVLLGPVAPMANAVEPGRRFTDAELEAMSADAAVPPEIVRLFPPLAPVPSQAAQEAGRVLADFRAKRMQFLVREGALGILQPAPGGGNGILVVQNPARGEGIVRPGDRVDALSPLPQIALAQEQFNRMVRTLDQGIHVRLEADVRTRFTADSSAVFNIVADLPGGDKRDEIVMIGAHFDSFHTGTGATDNGINAAMMMEAIRLLKISGLTLRRTVRLGLWGGEEQGQVGSKAYVARHFGGPNAATGNAGKVSAYFNADSGGSAIRGLFIQSNDSCAPILRTWMAPLRELGVTAIVSHDVTGTDHVPFNSVGIPGFVFIQDPVDYFTRSHHTSLDMYERVSADTVQRNTAIVAYFAYQAANLDDMLPRRPQLTR